MGSLLYNPVIAALEPSDRRLLLDRSIHKHVERGEYLCIAGEKTICLYVVLTGALKLIRESSGGTETVVGLAVEGDLIGDLDVLLGTARTHDAVASTKAEVARIETWRFLDTIEGSPGACLMLAQQLAERASSTETAMLDRTSGSSPGRVAARISELAERLGIVRGGTIELELPIDQTGLAELAGTSRESACRTLTTLRKSGVLDYRGRQMRILRPDLLDRLRCGGLSVRPFRSTGGEGRPLSRSSSDT